MSILKVENLSFSIGDEHKIIHGHMSMNEGDVILLTGPNGSGKSTIIKIIMGDTFDYPSLKIEDGKIYYNKNEKDYELLNSERNMEFFRKNVAYISQDDVFESPNMLDCFWMSIHSYPIKDKNAYVFNFIKKLHIPNAFHIQSDNLHLNHKAQSILRKVHSDGSEEDLIAAAFLSLDTRRLSGGQKKLVNILSNLIRYKFCDLIILDEPLNNLDYGNVRSFSNILTQIYREKPELGILLVTHCRSIPIVNKVIEIDPNARTLWETDSYICNTCFGKINEDGMYV